MLNCSDLACVLHHHHLYAHLHQLENHLNDENKTEGPEYSTLSQIAGTEELMHALFGVLVAITLVIIIIGAVAFSKLHKRHEAFVTHHPGIHTQRELFFCKTLLGCTFTKRNKEMHTSNVNSIQLQFVRTNKIDGTVQNSWVFPPNAPTPNLYQNCKLETLETFNGKPGFKGLRKQFSGRFKRLVKKADPVPAIPPELKPQLKTIYVY